MQYEYLDFKHKRYDNSTRDQVPLSNTHEMFIVEETEDIYKIIKGMIIEQFLNDRQVIFFNDSTSDESKLTVMSLLHTIPPDHFPFKEISLLKTLLQFRKDNFIKICEILQEFVWHAIKQEYLGLCFIFNFNRFSENRNLIINLESILTELFPNSFGFPIRCNCLYPSSSLHSRDLIELIGIHTGHQILGKQELFFPESYEDIKTDFNKQKTSSTLRGIAKRALAGNISPFYFQRGNKVIGKAYDLQSFCHQLESIPLDVFCFHCYRTPVLCNLDEKSSEPLPRSDIALWIQYSIGDTELARQIYETIKLSLGRIKNLESLSKFSKITMKNTIINLIWEKTAILSSII